MVYANKIVVTAPWRIWITGSAGSAGGIVITPDALQPEMQGTHTAFLAQLNLATAEVEYSSYFGGNGETSINTVLPQSEDRLLLAGWTRSANFPVTSGAFDTTHSGNTKAFVTYLDLPATVVSSTVLSMRQPGGSLAANSVSWVPTDSSVVLCGYAAGDGFPTTPGTLDSVIGPEWGDAWWAVLSADLSTLRYSTLMGGYDFDEFHRVQVGLDNTVWLAGESDCPEFPLTPDAYQPNQIGWGDAVLCQFSLPWIDAVEPPPILPPAYFSLSCFPIPFNSTTTLRFTLPVPCEVTLTLYDILGRAVLRKDLGRMTAGEYSEPLLAEELASGFYFVRLSAGELSTTQRILLLR